MKIEVINLDGLSTGIEVLVSHKDEEILFNVTSFGKNSFKDFNVFDQINDYWEFLPDIDKSIAFNYFKRIRETFNNVWDRRELILTLNQLSIEMTDFYDQHKLAEWISLKSSIYIPDVFEREYITDIDKAGSRDQTYIKSDYTKLIAMSMVLRTMIPVWGEYIFRTRQEAGTIFKEYYALQLLNNSKIVHCEAFEKLRLYIDKTVGADANNRSTIISGISSEDFSYWMLSLVCIRRLSIGDIRGTDPRANLVTFIYKFITQKINATESNGANTIKDKTNEDYANETELKLSVLERYKIKRTISIGEIVELGHSIEDLRSIAFMLSSNMTDELFNNSIASSQHLRKHNLMEPQLAILRWVFKPVISPRGLMYLPKETIINALGTCQAVLWARGHEYLALLTTAYAEVAGDVLMVTGVDSRARIPKDLTDGLNMFYPFFKRTGNMKAQVKPVNMAIHTIDNLIDSLGDFVWTMTADTELINKHFGSNHNRRITLLHTIRIDLAKLILEIASRKWV